MSNTIFIGNDNRLGKINPKKFLIFSSGDTADFRGPCGGYEYQPNSTKYLTLVVGGMSCQPAVQIIREIMAILKTRPL